MSISENIKLAFSTPDTFREIFQGSAEGIIMVDAEGIIQVANPVSERMFGYGQGELVGQPLEILLPMRYHARHVEFREKFNNNPAPRRMGVGRDLMAIRKDGTEFPVEVSLSYKEINKLLVVVAFVIDITERKKAEEALRRSEEQLLVYASELEKKVQARTEDLNKLVVELENANRVLQVQIAERKRAEEETRKALEKERELNELKTKFVSIASHEFRTPLSTVLSSASLIGRYAETNEKIDRHVQRIKSSVNHLTAILNDFLSLGKLEEGRIELEKEAVDISEFLGEVKEEVRPLLKEGQHLSLSCQFPNRKFNLDKRVMRNILFNLISNATKYSPEHKPITITCKSDNNSLTISVRDEGIGIPEGDLKYLFDRFFRASNATNIQGTGLGLNIVKRYTDLLKGSITFESAEGKGSTFRVSIPV